MNKLNENNRVKSHEVVDKIFPIISLEKELNRIEEFIAPDVKIFMDDKTCSTSIYWWYIWVAYLHKTALNRGIHHLKIINHSIERNESKFIATCRWVGRNKENKLEKSLFFELEYEVQNQKINKIWTKKKNYTFIYGNKIIFQIGYKFTIARLLLFSMFSNINEIKKIKR